MSKKVSSAATSPKSVKAEQEKMVSQGDDSSKKASPQKSGKNASRSELETNASSAVSSEAMETVSTRKTSRAKQSADVPNAPVRRIDPISAASESVSSTDSEKPARKSTRKSKTGSDVTELVASEPAASSTTTAEPLNLSPLPKKRGRKPKIQVELATESEAQSATQTVADKPKKSKSAGSLETAGPEPALEPAAVKTPGKRGPKGKSKKSVLTEAEQPESKTCSDTLGASSEAKTRPEGWDKNQAEDNIDEIELNDAELAELFDIVPKKRAKRSRKDRVVEFEERQDVFEMSEDRIDEEEEITEDEELEEDEEEDLEEDSDDFDASYDDDDTMDDSDDMDDDSAAHFDDDEPTPKRKVRKKKSSKIMSAEKKNRLLKKRLEAIHDGPCKICWGLFSPEMKKIQDYDFCDEAKARAKAAELSEAKGMRYFVQKLKVPVVKK